MKSNYCKIMFYVLSIIICFNGKVKAIANEINWNNKYPSYKVFREFNDISTDKKFSIKFSRKLDKNLINKETIQIKDSNNKSIPIEAQIVKNKVEVVPKVNLNHGQSYCLVINKNNKGYGWIKNGVICPINVKAIEPLPNNNNDNKGQPSSKDECNNFTQQQFIDLLVPGAKEAYNKYRVFPSVTIAQAILESNWGKSDKADKCKNIFGIKADKNWSGDKMELPTKEWINGKSVTVMAQWRVYSSFSQSIEDHGNFLYTRPKYAEAGVFHASNYKEQIFAIKKGGYATDPKYVEKICSLIEKYKLWKYDKAGRDLSQNT